MHLNIFVKRELSLDIPLTNRRLHPNERDIRNHMYLALTKTRKLMAKAQTSTDSCQSLGTVVNVINHNSHKENNTPKSQDFKLQKAVAIVCHIKSQTSNSPHHIKLHMETANAGLIFNRQLETSKVIVFAEDLPKLDFLQILEGTSNIKLIDPQKWSQYSTRKKQACTTEKVMSRNGSLENNDNSTSTPKLMPGQNKEYTTPDRENNNSTSTPKLMPGQNKEYTTPDEAFNALRSNERRINSMAIKQIVKNIRKENNDNSTSTPKLMPGQNKEYTTPDEAFNALRSNERRINSMAIKQIVENIRKLADLQTIDLSLIFCVKE
ncbi:unnamed protein product [Mytilus coruscus]|uniref:Uncharacterized protein n=1 Tax=Mytilus coruscus TaxID=42192 RepID=A0A6J8F266_MYTCO|nr:unnamed protein product [Mytilus coruscus]